MDCTQSLVEHFSHAFSEIDRRIIKATVLEYGNDIESAINDLIDISDLRKDSVLIDHLRVQCSSLLCPSEDVAVEQVSAEEEKLEVVGSLPTMTDGKQVGFPSENAVPCASDLQKDFYSACSVKDCENVENTSAEPSAVNGTGSKILDNYIDIADVTSSLEFTVQEARTDIDDVKNLIKEVGDLRAKADQERMAAENAEFEASRSGEDLLMKACEVNKQSQKVKEDNLKLSLELHGEKSVLSLEFEELNVRLEQMKQQKEKAVTTLNEMRDTLQSCYDIAHENRKRAEEDMQLKEEKAKKVLEQEEDSMAKIVQEAKTLKMEAEAFTLFREFLVDHGSIIDALQGEISNLCEDVNYLKKQVQGVQTSMNTVPNQELAQNPAPLHSLRNYHNIMSASASGEMTNSLGTQSSTSAPILDANHQRKSQFLCSSDSHGSTISTDDGFVSFMNNGRGLTGSMPMQEPPYIDSSYGSNVSWFPTFRYGAGHQDHALVDHGDDAVDPSGFGASDYHRSFGECEADFQRNDNTQGILSHEHHAFGKQGDILDGYSRLLESSASNVWQQSFVDKHGDISNGNGYMQGWSY